MVVSSSASRLALSIVASLFLTCVVSAQNTDPLKPLSGICRTTALTSLERRITTLNASCDRIQARLVKLQERKTARDLKDQTEIDRLEDLYGVQITRCSESFIDIDPGAGLKYDTAACSIIDEPGLDRARCRRVRGREVEAAHDADVQAALAVGHHEHRDAPLESGSWGGPGHHLAHELRPVRNANRRHAQPLAIFDLLPVVRSKFIVSRLSQFLSAACGS